MKLKPIQIKVWKIFTITFGVDWQKERLKDLVGSINWIRLESQIADVAGDQIADIVIRYVKTFIDSEIDSAQEED